jgi:MoaA/NifB/PqqE/SkfB family radical SAM enzyme
MPGVPDIKKNLELLSIDITSRCNLCCAHCYNESGGGGEKDISPEEIFKTFDAIKEYTPENICLCGGEPLLVPEVMEMLAAAGRVSPGVGMVSNGLLINPEVAGQLKENGLKTIQISLDGAREYQHDCLRGLSGSFKAACSAVKELKKAGVKTVVVDMIPNRLNYLCLEEYFELCLGLEVDMIRFMPFMPVGRGKKFGADLMLDDEEMLTFQRMLTRVRKQYKPYILAEWDDPVMSARFICRQIAETGVPKIISVFSNGDVATDVYAPVYLGNIRKNTIKDILDNALPKAIEAGYFEGVLNELHGIYDLETVRHKYKT